MNRFLVLAIVVFVIGTGTLVCATEVAKSPYGPDDEIGALNEITPASRFAVLSRIASGTVYDLSVDTFPGMPGLVHMGMGDPSFHMWMTHTPNGFRVEGISIGEIDKEFSLYDDAMVMSNHTGTHIDAINHAGYGDKIYNGFSNREHLGNKGWTVAGADKIPPIITRGVMIDVAGHKGVEMLTDSYEITSADLQQALAAHGVALEPGDAVFIRTGRMTTWPDPARYVPRAPGIGLDAARWLVAEGAIVIGADTIAVEQVPIRGKPVHAYLFAEVGIPLVELVWLEELARDHVYEFALIAAPIKIRGATGSPMRPIALPLTPK